MNTRIKIEWVMTSSLFRKDGPGSIEYAKAFTVG